MSYVVCNYFVANLLEHMQISYLTLYKLLPKDWGIETLGRDCNLTRLCVHCNPIVVLQTKQNDYG